ncbi:MAG: hypothetical protein K0R25_388 [Rickettsiaceae bacterium]|nr:hypothetical protein [Rickettsiaceae bacterium]
MKLKDVVKDWGGFEDLVKNLHQDGETIVKRKEVITGISGAEREIDVTLRHKNGPYEYLTLIECKHWKSRVTREKVDALYSSIDDLRASKGVIFTTIGYQSGAETYAKSKNITIFVIRELTDEEWGHPGKIIEFYLHIIEKTITKITTLDTKVSFAKHSTDRTNPGLDLVFDKDNSSANPILSEHKEKHKTIEEMLNSAAEHCCKEFQKRRLLINGGEKCVRYFSYTINLPFKPDLAVYQKDKIMFISKIEMDVGIKVTQSKITINRESGYDYAFAVQDCINNEIFATSKQQNSDLSSWQKLDAKNNTTDKEILKNKSIMSVIMKGFFDQNELPKVQNNVVV